MAPAAGLHFSRELMKRLEIKGVERGFLTLHCGKGNFRDIDVEDLTKHRMDSEEMVVDGDLVDKVNAAKDASHRVCRRCVGAPRHSLIGVHERSYHALQRLDQ